MRDRTLQAALLGVLSITAAAACTKHFVPSPHLESSRTEPALVVPYAVEVTAAEKNTGSHALGGGGPSKWETDLQTWARAMAEALTAALRRHGMPNGVPSKKLTIAATRATLGADAPGVCVAEFEVATDIGEIRDVTGRGLPGRGPQDACDEAIAAAVGAALADPILRYYLSAPCPP